MIEITSSGRSFVAKSLIFLLVLICLLTICAIDIAAVIIAEQDHEECNDMNTSTISPHMYLRIGGSIGIILYTISIMLQLFIFKQTSSDRNVDVNMQRNATLTCFIALFLFSWSMVGCALYTELTEDCQQTPIGEVLLAWAIIRLLVSFCGFFSFCKIFLCKREDQAVVVMNMNDTTL